MKISFLSRLPQYTVVMLISVGLLAYRITLFPVAHAKPLSQHNDGSVIVYISADARSLRLIQPDGSNDRLLWQVPDTIPGSPLEFVMWRPDAQQIAFTSTHEATCSEYGSDIFLINPDGSNLKRLTNGPACDQLAAYAQGSATVQISNQNANFSEYLVYIEGAPTAKVVTVAPGGTALVAFPQVADLGEGVRQLAVAVNGATRWFDASVTVDVTPGENAHAGTLTIAGGGFAAYGATNVTWSADGSRLAYQLGQGKLWQVGLDVALLGEGGPLLAPATNSQVLGARPVWSPVDNQVLYQRFGVSPQTITLAEADADNPGRALLDVKDTQGIGWLKDGSGLGVAAIDALLSHLDLYVYRFADNSIIQLTQTAPGQAALYPNFAPDNSRLVYTYVSDIQALPAVPVLRIMNSDGSDDHLLVEGGSRADWSRVQPQNPPATPEPTAQPTSQPTVQPTSEPTPGATPAPGGALSYRNYLPAVSR